MNVRRCVAVALGVILILPSASAAQFVRGQVVEANSGRPVAQVDVSLVRSDSTTVARALTDSLGTFWLAAGRPGSYQLRAARVGYASTLSDVIHLSDSDTLLVQVVVAVNAIQLRPLVARAEATLERGRDGFVRRRSLGKGYFLTRDSLDRRRPRSASAAFTGVPRIMVDYTDTGQPIIKAVAGFSCLSVLINNSIKPVSFTQARSSTLMASGVGGGRGRIGGDYRVTNLERRAGSELDMLVSPEGIAGIEIYPSFTDVPKEFLRAFYADIIWPLNSSGRCGVAIVWTHSAW